MSVMLLDGVCVHLIFFFFNDTATTEIYTLSLHDALPILALACVVHKNLPHKLRGNAEEVGAIVPADVLLTRSEEHTSELQSRLHLVCRLLLEKKKKKTIHIRCIIILSDE